MLLVLIVDGYVLWCAVDVYVFFIAAWLKLSNFTRQLTTANSDLTEVGASKKYGSQTPEVHALQAVNLTHFLSLNVHAYYPII